MCHAAEPFWDGIAHAPKNVKLETEADIARHAREIYLQAGRSHAMPPGNITYIEPEERRLIVAWYESTLSPARKPPGNDSGLLRGRTLSFASRGRRRVTMKQSYVYEEDGALLMSMARSCRCRPLSIRRPREAPDDVDNHRSPAVPAAAGLYRSAYSFPANAGDGELCGKSSRMAQYLHIRGGTALRRATSMRPALPNCFRRIAASGHDYGRGLLFRTQRLRRRVFPEAARRNLLMVGGKVMMDRNAPESLTDTAQTGYDDTKAVIETWHGIARNHVAITPRFAITSHRPSNSKPPARWRANIRISDPDPFVGKRCRDRLYA
jgi:hypothetical protein